MKERLPEVAGWMQEAAIAAARRHRRDPDTASLLPGMVRPGRFRPIKVIDLELDDPSPELSGPEGYVAVLALVRWAGEVVGHVRIPVQGGRINDETMRRAISQDLGEALLDRVIDRRLQRGLQASGAEPDGPATPIISVAICTRDRPESLQACLESIAAVDYPAFEVIVVDNAPADSRTRDLVRENWPRIRYLEEARNGLDWARNRALSEATGEIVAYTDDDVMVDPAWLRGVAQAFADGPDVAAVTGLVVPLELEHEAQILFERLGGFGRGFKPRWIRSGPGKTGRAHVGPGDFGTGANMAYRRSVLNMLGGFDPALDVGTPTHGGGDLEMFFRIVEEGYTLLYEPNALVRHRHRADLEALTTQARNNGIGFYSFVVRSAYAYPDRLKSFVWIGMWNLRHNLKRLGRTIMRPSRIPRSLVIAELRGSITGLFAYRRSRALARDIAAITGSRLDRLRRRRVRRQPLEAGTVATVDLREPVPGIPASEGFQTTRVYATLGEELLGFADIPNAGQAISARRLRAALAGSLRDRLVGMIATHATGPGAGGSSLNGRGAAHAAGGSPVAQGSSSPDPLLERPERDAPEETRAAGSSLHRDAAVSIVLATLDRPDDLRECLACLSNLETERSVETIVVDNNPASGVTAMEVLRHSGVTLVSEARRGLSYARNAGIAAATGDIIVMTDDDVRMPPQWLERLLAPFSRDDVAAVTGNVLPLEMTSDAQQYFEAYGGLGRGFTRREYDGYWFDRSKGAVKTWLLGATANAAFRASIFDDPEIGPLTTVLGAGTPAPVGEDTYLFYKILKVGHTIVYEPDAYVWHRHRRQMTGLRKQLYDYSKGHVAYHLVTLVDDHDLRALTYLGWEIPRLYAWRLKRRVRGQARYPMKMEFVELRGHLAGPLAYWKAIRRARRLERLPDKPLM